MIRRTTFALRSTQVALVLSAVCAGGYLMGSGGSAWSSAAIWRVLVSTVLAVTTVILAEINHRRYVRVERLVQRAERRAQEAIDIRIAISGVANWVALELKAREAAPRKVSIERPPGHRIARVLQLLLPRRAFETIVLQTIADMRLECFDALEKHDIALYKATILRSYVTIAGTLAMWLWTTAGSRLYAVWKVVK